MAKVVTCFNCTSESNNCCGATGTETFAGLKIVDGSQESRIYRPYSSVYSTTDNSAALEDYKGNRHYIKLSETSYPDLATLRAIIDNCLCPATGSSSQIYEYQVSNGGNSVNVVATGTGITYALAGGVATITIPNGVRLLNWTIVGTAADASYTATGVSNGLKVIEDYQGTQNINNDWATLRAKNPAVIDGTNSGGPSDTLRLVYDPGAVQKSITSVSGGKVEYLFNNLGNRFGAGWAVVA